MEKTRHRTFTDHRGRYTPIPHDTLGIAWTQTCISVNSKRFTFRGMHYQTDPPQTKYITVIKGSILDFTIDLSTNELDWARLDQDDAVLVGPDKAHGFLTLEDDTVVAYLVQGEWSPETEKSMVWSSHPRLRTMIGTICGPDGLTISEKDRLGK